ncbi:MAG: hypothetical protein ABIP28_04220 [Mucilaginibacter sp.]
MRAPKFLNLFLVLLSLTSCVNHNSNKEPIRQLKFHVLSIDLFTVSTTEETPYAAINITVLNQTKKPFHFVNRNSILSNTPYKSKLVLFDTVDAMSYPLFSTLKQEERLIDTGEEGKFNLILDSVFFEKKFKKELFSTQMALDIQKVLKRCKIYYHLDRADQKYNITKDTLYKIDIAKNVPFNFR